jgi:hypothetical protein
VYVSHRLRVHPFFLLIPFRIKSEPSGVLGTCMRKRFLRNCTDNSLLSYTSFKWPIHSVEQLPSYSPQKLKNPVLIIGNSVRTAYPSHRNHPAADNHDPQADPITPLASAKKVADMFGDNAFLVEQLALGHTSFAQFSSCTALIMKNYLADATVRVFFPPVRLLRIRRY